MRPLLITLLALLIFACQPAAEQPAAEAPAEETVDLNMEAFEKNSKTVRQFIDKFIAKDLDGMKALISEDFFASPPEWGLDSLNPAQWQEREQYFMDNYSDITFEDDQYFAGLDDDQTPNGDVRVYGNWHFTYNGNNQRGAMKWYSVFFFNDDGKISGQMEWFNTADLVPEAGS